jgi:hypothetical protein
MSAGASDAEDEDEDREEDREEDGVAIPMFRFCECAKPF